MFKSVLTSFCPNSVKCGITPKHVNVQICKKLLCTTYYNINVLSCDIFVYVICFSYFWFWWISVGRNKKNKFNMNLRFNLSQCKLRFILKWLILISYQINMNLISFTIWISNFLSRPFVGHLFSHISKLSTNNGILEKNMVISFCWHVCHNIKK